MNINSLLDINQSFEKWLNEYSNDLGSDVAALKNKCGIESTESLQKSLEKMQEDNRLLQVGVIGSVKAGKSSLINALVFNGENILPRAATPMTAALTTLTWGETFSAKINFYDEKDIEYLEDAAQKYEALVKKEYETLLEHEESKGKKHGQAEEGMEQSDDTAEPEESLRRNIPPKKPGLVKKAAYGVKNLFTSAISQEAKGKIHKRAEISVKNCNPIEAAAYDQYQRIKASGIKHEHLPKDITADNEKALARELQEFVGSTGLYMPLTKSVDIFLPLDSLRDIRIIDTPGFNDPVVSREARTEALLKDCEVVFIVSRSAQFLTEQDLHLMNRLTQKEGIRDITVISSQIDMSIYGSEKRDTLSETLENLSKALGQHLLHTVRNMKEKHPEIGTTFDGLLEQGAEGKILHTSGICHSLSMRFDERKSWDSGEKTVWGNLKNGYPEAFDENDKEKSCYHLDMLANIQPLQDRLSTVRERKDEILAARRSDFIKTKTSNLSKFYEKLLGLCHERDKHIREADAAEKLKKEKIELEEKTELIANDLGHFMGEEVVKLYEEIRTELNNIVDTAFERTKETTSDSLEEISVEKEIKKRGFFPWLGRLIGFGGMKTITETTKEIYTLPVRDALEKYLLRRGDELIEISNKKIIGFKKNITKEIISATRKHLDERYIDSSRILRSVSNVSSSMNIPRFSLDEIDLKLLNEFKQRVRDKELEKFYEAFEKTVSLILTTLRDDISRFLENIKDLDVDGLAEALFTDIGQRISQIESAIAQKTASLERLGAMIEDLDRLKHKISLG